MPVDLARAMGADFVMAVNVIPQPDDPMETPQGGGRHMPTFLETAWDAVGIMCAARLTTKMQMATPDVLVQPRLSHDMGVFSSFTRAAEIIARGQQAAGQPWRTWPRWRPSRRWPQLSDSRLHPHTRARSMSSSRALVRPAWALTWKVEVLPAGRWPPA
jgi:predicted acylesterase/phospholipase RssA